MEKRRPPYPLPEIKRLIRQGCYRATRTALFCAVRDFDLVDASEMAEWVLDLRTEDFYKAMTTIHDSKLWQDVYHKKVQGVSAYVKVPIVDSTTVIISFKHLEED